MRPDGVRIQALVWRTFTPAIVIAAVALGALVYARLHHTIIDGFSRKLITTSALAGALVDPADHDWLIQAARVGAPSDLVEKDPRYVRNVMPMRAIRRNLDLTYLYSQVIGGTKGVVYVLDATEGEEHSAIGSEDELPADTLAGLKATTATGSIYVSPIQYQEQWGLLKTAAAPLRSADGRIAATMGADVNISVIQVATQNALFTSALIGVASLLACAMATLAILRFVAQPIEGLKADALRIAAGDRAPPKALRAPREVTALRDALGDLAAQLVAAMRAARAEMAFQDHRRNLDLLDALLADEPDLTVLADTPAELGVWIDLGGDGAAAGLRRRAMRGLAARIAERPDLAADWAGLADPENAALLRVDRAAPAVAHLAGVPLTLRIGGKKVALRAGERRALAVGQSVAVVLSGGERAIAWEAGA
jgi:hypothetical protein